MNSRFVSAIHPAFLLSLVFVASLALTGCDSNGSNDEPVTAQIRFMHASADAGDLTITAGGEEVTSGVAFNRRPNVNPTVTRRFDVSIEGSIEIQNDAGDVLTTIEGAQFEAEEPFLVIVAGGIAAGEQSGRDTPQAFVLRDDLPDIGSDEVALRLVHASAGAPAIDVFWVPPGEDPSSDNELASGVPFSETLPASVRGDFDVRTVPNEGRILTVPTAAGPLQLPIGTQGGGSLSPGRIITAVAIDTEPGASFPVAALVQVD